MTQLIICAVHAWRRVRAVVVKGAACVRGERRRRVGGDDSSSGRLLAGWGTCRWLVTGVAYRLLDFVWVPNYHRSLVINDGAWGRDWWRCRCCRGYFTKEECLQGLDCGELIGRGFLHSLDCRGEAGHCVENPVGGCDSGEQDGMVVEPEGVSDALATGVGN
jgi:hypothetical protein